MMAIFKTPSRIQFEATECGAISLSIILGYYGKWPNLEEIRIRCMVGRDGANLANTARAAQYFGLNVDLYQYTAEEFWKDFDKPTIVFWNKNHFLVVEGFDKNYVYLSDPARGRRKISHGDFNKSFSEYCLICSPGDKFIKSGYPPSEGKQLLEVINTANIPGIILSIALGFATTIPTIGLAAISTYFTDSVIENIRNTNNGYIWILVLFTFILLISTELMYMIQRRLQVFVNNSIIDRLFNKIFSMPLPFYTQRDLGELANRIAISSKISTALTGPFASVSVGITQIIVYSTALLFFNVWLTILILIASALIVTCSYKFLSVIDQLSKRSSISTGKMASTLLYITNNAEQVKGNGLEAELFSQWSDYFTDFTNSSSQTSLTSQNASAGIYFMNNISDYLTIFAGGLLIIWGRLSMSEFIGMRILAQGIFSPLGAANSFITAIKGLNGELNRLYDIFDNSDDPLVSAINQSSSSAKVYVPYENYIEQITGNSENSNITDEILRDTSVIIEDVDYGYPGTTKSCLENINLTIPAGSITAICGPSGCGKSTLLKLIAGLNSPSSGNIKVGEIEINKLDKNDFLSSISYTDTDIFIINDSVFNNVTLYNPAYTVDEVVEALKNAQIYETIAQFPNGINHILTADGSDLSGGQKQRVQLARAFLRKPLLTIMDESTSALDYETERNVLTELTIRSNTLIATTHRPGLLKFATQVVLMTSEGGIDCVGKYDELLVKSENFRRLFGIKEVDIK